MYNLLVCVGYAILAVFGPEKGRIIAGIVAGVLELLITIVPFVTMFYVITKKLLKEDSNTKKKKKK